MRFLISLCATALVASWSGYALADDIPPSTPYDVKAVMVTLDSVRVTWVGSGDDEREGQALSYELRRAAEPITDDTDWQLATISPFNRSGDISSKQIEALVEGLDMGDKGYFAVRAVDDADNMSAISKNAYFEIKNPFLMIQDRITEEQDEALRAGHESNGLPLYACVAWHEGGLYPGKFASHLRGCLIPYDRREIRARVHRLVRASNAGEWAEDQIESIPSGAIQYGRHGTGFLYLCRGHVAGGLHIGYMTGEEKKCRIPWGGSERLVAPYGVLVD